MQEELEKRPVLTCSVSRQVVSVARTKRTLSKERRVGGEQE